MSNIQSGNSEQGKTNTTSNIKFVPVGGLSSISTLNCNNLTITTESTVNNLNIDPSSNITCGNLQLPQNSNVISVNGNINVSSLNMNFLFNNVVLMFNGITVNNGAALSVVNPGIINLINPASITLNCNYVSATQPNQAINGNYIASIYGKLIPSSFLLINEPNVDLGYLIFGYQDIFAYYLNIQFSSQMSNSEKIIIDLSGVDITHAPFAPYNQITFYNNSNVEVEFITSPNYMITMGNYSTVTIQTGGRVSFYYDFTHIFIYNFVNVVLS